MAPTTQSFAPIGDATIKTRATTTKTRAVPSADNKGQDAARKPHAGAPNFRISAHRNVHKTNAPQGGAGITPAAHEEVSVARATISATRADDFGGPRNDFGGPRNDSSARRDELEQRPMRQEQTRNEGPVGGQAFLGQVTKVRSDTSFDISVDGTTYNVYSASALAGRLKVGDSVRVNGVRQDKNDIRQAVVSLMRR